MKVTVEVFSHTPYLDRSVLKQALLDFKSDLQDAYECDVMIGNIRED